MNGDNAELKDRAATVRRMMAESLRGMSAAERDRRMQVFLSQSRGTADRATALRRMTGLLVRARRAVEGQGVTYAK